MDLRNVIRRVRPSLLPIAGVLVLSWIGGRLFFAGAQAGREALPFFFGMGLLVIAGLVASILLFFRFRVPPSDGPEEGPKEGSKQGQ